MIVAIDGPAGSGKSAVGRRVAEALGLRFVDSGLLYRAVAVAAVTAMVDPADEAAVSRLAESSDLRVDGGRVWVDGEEVTGHVYAQEISTMASRVAQVGGVRRALVDQQRRLGEGGVVMAGRDIGTVIFPGADRKFFLSASIEERVRRRARQLRARGEHPDPDRMRAEVRERDRADSERALAPLRAADDAELVDTDDLDLEGVVAHVLARVRG